MRLAIGLLLLLSTACFPTGGGSTQTPSTAPAGSRTVDGLLAKYDAGLAKTKYVPVPTTWSSFTASTAQLPFEATKGRCYKLVVLADLDDHGVTNHDTVARWGDLDYQRARGESKFSDGDALFDLGCFQTGVVSRTPLRATLTSKLELVDLEATTPGYTARLYSLDVGEAEVDARWAELGKQEDIEDRQTGALLDRCANWRGRFVACNDGKRPKDYAPGVSCKAAAEKEREGFGAASCGAL